MIFNEAQLQTISNALRVAADEFGKLARSFPDNLGAQFTRQQNEALKIYVDIETRTGISG